MIPKIIHYCWFGGKPLPRSARRCIESWRKFLPDYEIKEWNEQNFDVECCRYVAQAYAARKYAFVSDYARYLVLLNEGGLYFDTDVEVIAPMDELIDHGPFVGIEKSLATNGTDPTAPVGVAPGLGMAALPGMPFVREILDYYSDKDFSIEEGTIVYHTTRLLREHGFVNANSIQHVAGFTIYPDDYLCPMDSTTGIITKTPNTVAIHHYACSWINHNTLSFRLHQLKNLLIRIFGPGLIMKLTRGG